MALTRKETAPTEKELKTISEVEQDRNEVLDLKMHERCWVRNTGKDVYRVQSGWLYSDWNSETDTAYNTIFVLDTRINEK